MLDDEIDVTYLCSDWLSNDEMVEVARAARAMPRRTPVHTPAHTAWTRSRSLYVHVADITSNR